MGEDSSDWAHHVSAKDLPALAANRALWKSPYYIRISTSVKETDTVYFTLSIITKNGKQVERKKR